MPRHVRNLLSVGSPGSARIGQCASMSWASSSHLVPLEEFSNDSLWTHCKCFYSSASVDHSSQPCVHRRRGVFCGGSFRLVLDSIRDRCVECRVLMRGSTPEHMRLSPLCGSTVRKHSIVISTVRACTLLMTVLSVLYCSTSSLCPRQLRCSQLLLQYVTYAPG